MNQKHIHITSKDGKVDHDNESLKRNGDEAVWDSDTGDAYRVIFRDDSPFEKKEFPVGPGGGTPSGPVRADAAEKSYKYDVVGPGGTNDPTIIIQK